MSFSKETVDKIFELMDAEEATKRIHSLGISAEAKSQWIEFINRFRSQGFMALRKPSNEYWDSVKSIISQWYFIATPLSHTWIKFRANEGSILHGKWFFFNHGRSLYPMGNPRFDRLSITGQGRPLVFAWENSDNEELLNKPDAEKAGKYPYYFIRDHDHLIGYDMGKDNPVEDSPVYIFTLEQVKTEGRDGLLKPSQLKPLFKNYVDMLAHIDQIQYVSHYYQDAEDWRLPYEEQEEFRKAGIKAKHLFKTIT